MFGEATSEPQQGCDWRLKAGSGFELQQAGNDFCLCPCPYRVLTETRGLFLDYGEVKKGTVGSCHLLRRWGTCSFQALISWTNEIKKKKKLEADTGLLVVSRKMVINLKKTTTRNQLLLMFHEKKTILTLKMSEVHNFK